MGMQECRNLIKGRKKDIEEYKEIELPDRIIIAKNGGCEIILDDTVPGKDGLAGMAVSAGIVRGPVLVLEKFDPAANFNGKILVTYQTDPGWSLVFPLLKGVILERGNALSHASILSREMNIPLVVKVKNAVSLLKNCRQVELNGNNGNIKIIEK
jgi:pyruvate,water dikinase